MLLCRPVISSLRNKFVLEAGLMYTDQVSKMVKRGRRNTVCLGSTGK